MPVVVTLPPSVVELLMSSVFTLLMLLFSTKLPLTDRLLDWPSTAPFMVTVVAFSVTFAVARLTFVSYR